MLEPLTVAHLTKALGETEARLVQHIDERFKENDQLITEFKAHVDERFDRLEHLLTLAERLERLELRTRRIAERSGFPDLATSA